MGAVCLRWLCRVGLGGRPFGVAKKRGFYGQRIGALASSSLISVNFLELRKGEVQLRRILIPRTPVNKGDEAGPELLRPGPASCFLLILALGLAARTR